MPEHRDQKSLLDRLLGVFATVRAGEGVTAVLLFVDVFLILTAYYVLKTVREGLLIGGGGFLGLGGDEVKIYASAGMAFLLLGVIPAYGLLASSVSRIRLLNYCVLGVIGCLLVFFVLGRAGVPLGLPFFLWLGVVSVFLIAQFWSYANDIYTEEQGKRLFGIIAAGGSLGAILGPKIAHLGKDYTYGLMAGAAVLLGVCQLLYNVVNRRVSRHAAAKGTSGDAGDDADAPVSKEGGFRLVLRERYLLLIAVMLLLANLVNTTGEFILSNAAKTHAADVVPATAHADISDPERREAAIEADRTAVVTGFYGDFFFWVNLAGFLIQVFLVSRILEKVGVRVALFVLPTVAFGAYGLIGAVSGLGLLRVAKTAENSIDYSLQNTVRQALFLPTSRAAKYKAKAAIDTFFVRVGDALAAGTVFVGIHFLSFDARTFAFVNVGLTIVWLAVAFGIARKHRELVPPGAPSTQAREVRAAET